jgi:serine/threonine protein kinase
MRTLYASPGGMRPSRSDCLSLLSSCCLLCSPSPPQFDEKLGSGAYKEVFLSYDTETGKEVAWNTVTLARLPPGERKRIRMETEILNSLDHPHIINFFNVWDNPERGKREERRAGARVRAQHASDAMRSCSSMYTVIWLLMWPSLLSCACLTSSRSNLLHD